MLKKRGRIHDYLERGKKERFGKWSVEQTQTSSTKRTQVDFTFN